MPAPAFSNCALASGKSPREGREAKIKMRNGIGRQHFGDRLKLALRFLLAIQKPKHRPQIFARRPKLRIQAHRLAIELFRLARSSNCVYAIPICWHRFALDGSERCKSSRIGSASWPRPCFMSACAGRAVNPGRTQRVTGNANSIRQARMPVLL